MTSQRTESPAMSASLRLWPGVVAAALVILVRYLMPLVVPDAGGMAMVGGVAGALAIVVWWLFFSRAAWVDRLGALGLMAVALLATSRFVHPSISNGMMGMMLPFFAVPVMTVALVIALAAGRSLAAGARRALVAGAIVLGAMAFTTIRTAGITGDAASDLHWRWTPTPEERLLAHADEPATPPVAAPSTAPVATEPAETSASAAPASPTTPWPETPAASTSQPTTDAASAAPVDPLPPRRDPEWPGFRGPSRDSVARGVRIETDWARTPPVERWRRPIGPGWSSFAVDGDLFYTQEQRGDDEMVSCYRLSTGEAVWRHRDAARFWESNGGAGPRGTPTLHRGRVYSFGATGIVNALDAATGAVAWSRDAGSDLGRKAPDWGFASSPLAVDDEVIVAVAGQLIAYDAATGAIRWRGDEGGGGYSSPHLATIAGVPQVLLIRGARTISVRPADGSLLWDHTWEPSGAFLQPAVSTDGTVLLAVGDAMGGMGLRRLAVGHDGPTWSVQERWTSRGLKPYFNDFVVHGGHAYGFDASILASVNLTTGERAWKGGRYGHGQMLLLPEQDLLLVLSEDGEIALVKATPDGFTEVARVPALNGKTWNHPALVGDTLLVRNGEEMAAFRLLPVR